MSSSCLQIKFRIWNMPHAGKGMWIGIIVPNRQHKCLSLERQTIILLKLLAKQGVITSRYDSNTFWKDGFRIPTTRLNFSVTDDITSTRVFLFQYLYPR